MRSIFHSRWERNDGLSNKGGRPRKEIDKDIFENLCGIQCTLAEISAAFDVDDATVDTWCKKTYKTGFSETFRAKRGKGQISLRRKQMQLANSGNCTMLIWLGKQYLGQRDKFDAEISGEVSVIKIDVQDEAL